MWLVQVGEVEPQSAQCLLVGRMRMGPRTFSCCSKLSMLIKLLSPSFPLSLPHVVLSYFPMINWLLILSLATLALAFTPTHTERSVFTIPYTRSFRRDTAPDSMGCNHRVAYASFTYPEGPRDALYISMNRHVFKINGCGPKETYAKIFGYAQNYDELIDAKIVASKISSVRENKLIIDWKADKDLERARKFLNDLLNELKGEVYLKVPASHLCKQVGGQPYILGLSNIKNVIVEMHGEDVLAYRTAEQIFTSQDIQLDSSEYPDSKCPKFPSYEMLNRNHPGINFYIEMTLQQEEVGYLGKEFDRMLEGARGVYDKVVFYDAFPPNIIHL